MEKDNSLYHCYSSYIANLLDMLKPVGIQRKRTKGYNMQQESLAINGLNAVSITRPGKWGNPFLVSVYGVKRSVELFEECLRMPPKARIHFTGRKAYMEVQRFWWMRDHLYLLKNKNLACFCPLTQKCHRDILLKYANQ